VMAFASMARTSRAVAIALVPAVPSAGEVMTEIITNTLTAGWLSVLAIH
jgi:hypothetical protein